MRLHQTELSLCTLHVSIPVNLGDAMTSTEYAVRALLDRRSEAIWARDIDGLISCYSPDIVYFDIVPPLQYVGLAALRGRFLNWFDGFESPKARNSTS
jgi:ketosteroid isomerase-like protein